MYHPTTRVLTVLELLQSHPQMSGRELAARLEVDGRTVRRYVTMLQDLGIPIEAERGRYGAYRLRPGYKLPPLMFSEDEALALTLGLMAARQLGLAAAAPATQGALAKIERVLPATLRQRVQAVQQTVALSEDLDPAYDQSILVTVSLAAQQGQAVQLRYRGYKVETTDRTVDPYGVVYYTGCWYMAGYCHLRQGLRTFRLDRIVAAQPTEGHFTRPTDFDLLDHVIRSLVTMPNRWTVTALLRTTLTKARQHISPTVAQLCETADGVLLQCTVGSLDWAARYLIGLGFPFSVCDPPELKDALREIAAEITALRSTVCATNPAHPNQPPFPT